MLISYFNFCDIEGISDKVKGEVKNQMKNQKITSWDRNKWKWAVNFAKIAVYLCLEQYKKVHQC